MSTISEHQTLIQTVLLTAEQEMDEFIQRGLESDSEDIEMDSLTDSSDSSSSRSSVLSLSSSSESSSSSSSASSSSSSSSSSSGIQITVSDIGSDDEEHAFAMEKQQLFSRLLQRHAFSTPMRLQSPHSSACKTGVISWAKGDQE